VAIGYFCRPRPIRRGAPVRGVTSDTSEFKRGVKAVRTDSRGWEALAMSYLILASRHPRRVVIYIRQPGQGREAPQAIAGV